MKEVLTFNTMVLIIRNCKLSCPFEIDRKRERHASQEDSIRRHGRLPGGTAQPSRHINPRLGRFVRAQREHARIQGRQDRGDRQRLPIHLRFFRKYEDAQRRLRK